MNFSPPVPPNETFQVGHINIFAKSKAPKRVRPDERRFRCHCLPHAEGSGLTNLPARGGSINDCEVADLLASLPVSTEVHEAKTVKLVYLTHMAVPICILTGRLDHARRLLRTKYFSGECTAHQILCLAT